MNQKSTLSPASLRQAPRMSLVDSTIGVIRTHIESGAWAVGERIPKEQELADMLQVGRNTVREAIRVLSHANVLEVRQGDGTYVRSSVDPTEIMRQVARSSMRDHYELKAILEAAAARLAATNRSEEDVVILRDLLKARGEQHDERNAENFADADMAFHAAIVRMSNNTALVELYRYLSGTLRTDVLSVMADADLPEPGLLAHKAIVDAIAREDGEGAAAAARAVVAPLISALTTKSAN
jgi:DNA-binding FadR family transcriptional regulator